VEEIYVYIFYVENCDLEKQADPLTKNIRWFPLNIQYRKGHDSISIKFSTL